MQVRTGRAIDTAMFAAVVLLVGVVLLVLPGSGPLEVAWRIAFVPLALWLFIFLGFRLIGTRADVGRVVLLFLVGLVVELLTFAMLYRGDGVLCAMTQAGPQGQLQLIYESRSDITSCIHLSVDVWTAGGYGSVMAKDSQGWLVAAQQLVGYSYMAIYMAILITVLHRRVQCEPP